MPILPGETLFGLQSKNQEAYPAVLLHGSQQRKPSGIVPPITWGEPSLVEPSAQFTFLEPACRGGKPRDNGLVLDYAGGENMGYVTFEPVKGQHHCLLIVMGVDAENLAFIGTGHRASPVKEVVEGDTRSIQRTVSTQFFKNGEGSHLTIHATTMPLPSIPHLEVDGVPTTPTTHGVREAAREAIEAVFPAVTLPALTTVRSQ